MNRQPIPMNEVYSNNKFIGYLYNDRVKIKNKFVHINEIKHTMPNVHIVWVN